MENRDETTGLGASPQGDGDPGPGPDANPPNEQPAPSDPGDENDSDK
jgi:hypothetical protein